jgi:AcrR family transcriptional regulator
MTEALDLTIELEPARRRSQAERSASTRARVIAAARDVLFAQGYSGATMHEIRKAAGMSLGAVQHQFPSKARLMAAVAQDFAERQKAIYADAIRRGRTPREAMENLIDASLASVALPEAAATLEIHLARRSDPELDQEIAPAARRFDKVIARWGRHVLRAAGVNDDERLLSVQLLSNAVSRGLITEHIRNGDKAAIERATRMWRTQMLLMLFGPD